MFTSKLPTVKMSIADRRLLIVKILTSKLSPSKCQLPNCQPSKCHLPNCHHRNCNFNY
jgi:hypothetical protein